MHYLKSLLWIIAATALFAAVMLFFVITAIVWESSPYIAIIMAIIGAALVFLYLAAIGRMEDDGLR